ncbi:MAG: DNA mismatch repair endonuclease MutL [Akkermansiaceae bacterium]|nr:DNA mismatch repair endonuclease MutL [Akkermansiaceae bacterium]
MSELTETRIHRMDDVLASQVAAGEVVERPSSVVKELVENSIDAGATLVRVEIRRGGVSLIKVTDNGCGMSRADAALCLERHATSKLLSYEDLFDIRQLGFRGEALPSIASVAQVQITTRRADEIEGTRINCHGGELQPPMNAGCAPGTEIAVSNLFFNTPVRRKFLKSDDTEFGHIEHQLRLHALAFPQVRFILVKDGTVVFDVPATTDLRQRISEFVGRETASALLRIKPTHGPGVKVSGFLMPLSEARRNRRLQFVFLNGRPIEDKIVARAVRDGYGGFPTGLHPALFLYLEVDPGLVDVNVHPAKREVRFRRPSDLTTCIIDAIAGTLSVHARGDKEAEPTPEPPPLVLRPVLEPQQRELQLPPRETPPAPRPQPAPPVPRPQPVPAPQPPAEPSPQPHRPATVPAPAPVSRPQPVEPARPTTVAPPAQAVESPPPVVQAPCKAQEQGAAVPNFRFIGVLADSYLLFENKEGLVMLSPRAARERIIFERLLNSNHTPIHSQRLLVPVMLELDPRDMGIALEVREQLQQAGFLISPFGQKTLRVEAVPMMLSLPRVEEFMLELIRSFTAGETRFRKARNPFEPYALRIAKQYATKEDIRPWLQAPTPLLADLLRCEIPYCTPSGKPTLVPITLNEISRKFQSA